VRPRPFAGPARWEHRERELRILPRYFEKSEHHREPERELGQPRERAGRTRRERLEAVDELDVLPTEDVEVPVGERELAVGHPMHPIGAKRRHEPSDAEIRERGAEAFRAIACVHVRAVAQRREPFHLENVAHAFTLESHVVRELRQHERPVSVPFRVGSREDLLHAGADLGARVRRGAVELHPPDLSSNELLVALHPEERLAGRRRGDT
jgi:hypothetical protein